MQTVTSNKERAITVFKLQCNFYDGNKYKALLSLSESNRTIIKEVYPELFKTKRKKKKEKLEYYNKCWKITEQNAPLIKDIEKRKFKSYDIDHIVPISYGYRNNIPAELIGSLENLRMLPNKENLLKNFNITDESKKILLLWKEQKLI